MQQLLLAYLNNILKLFGSGLKNGTGNRNPRLNIIFFTIMAPWQTDNSIILFHYFCVFLCLFKFTLSYHSHLLAWLIKLGSSTKSCSNPVNKAILVACFKHSVHPFYAYSF